MFEPGWSLSVAALERIQGYGLRPDWSVLEYGPGLSTFVIQEHIKPNTHLCVDEPGPYGLEFKSLALERKLAIDLDCRPLDSYFNTDSIFDLILLDGPALIGSRVVAYQSLLDCSHSKSILIIDDTHRKEEAELALRLKNTGNWNAIVIKDSEYNRTTIFLEPR